MSRIAYVSGLYVAHANASIHVEDRGYQFADGVYEVVSIHGGRLADDGPHLDRLDRSLAELRIAPPMSRRALGLVMRQVIRRNRVRDGMITEGTSTNAWVVTDGGELVTRDPGAAILNGITRLAVLKIAREQGVSFVERAFSLAEARAAREAFVTSTTSFVMPVTAIDGEPVGEGRPGPLARALGKRYFAYMAGGEEAHA